MEEINITVQTLDLYSYIAGGIALFCSLLIVYFIYRRKIENSFILFFIIGIIMFISLILYSVSDCEFPNEIKKINYYKIFVAIISLFFIPLSDAKSEELNIKNKYAIKIINEKYKIIILGMIPILGGIFTLFYQASKHNIILETEYEYGVSRRKNKYNKKCNEKYYQEIE